MAKLTYTFLVTPESPDVCFNTLAHKLQRDIEQLTRKDSALSWVSNIQFKRATSGFHMILSGNKKAKAVRGLSHVVLAALRKHWAETLTLDLVRRAA